ncbi:DUF1507 family protein [Loigolactobacillus backii]|uniref:Uncharacterized protein n=1 Tax=Loigolactobacillus backii TaxID=375175 RepID=A0A192H4D9_9LACO|nr:DUF1507 family protein [Loigolactobacillus backii]ANK59711.1 hypothetical protein AYR52_05250 [Loigolactobacillus backii]ANK63113.1 hypothetical protein AYR53_10280 [Loigolactobacillus backii]ANK64707.1 hypothetical protein AYR54_05270 [Loigolactobacillus backii]ANK66844.1 hypothetical protein AYR55_03470 [Loigolactobacillus backii]ANK69879.1 hypothetical protein AYR56_06725 [Loigolactobacillus backii]
MADLSERQNALKTLEDDAENIIRLVGKQQVSLCLSQCPAFEEVVDTQMFGYSKEVTFAIRTSMVDPKTGHNLVRDLEKRLNEIYNESFEKQRQKK